MTAQGLVPSPCVDVCRMDARSGLCAGCSRTLDEIAGWSAMSEPQKRAVWRQLDARRDALVKERQPISKERR